jgi:IPT/TIG domain-containing protein
MIKEVYRLGLAIFLLSAVAWAQAGPKLTGVDPNAGKVGDTCTITGENLGKDTVNAVLVSDEEKDYPAEVVSQEASKIVMKVPKVKAGGYNISIKIGNNIYIQPIRYTVQE